jgi:hypothetical protein
LGAIFNKKALTLSGLFCFCGPDHSVLPHPFPRVAAARRNNRRKTKVICILVFSAVAQIFLDSLEFPALYSLPLQNAHYPTHSSHWSLGVFHQLFLYQSGAGTALYTPLVVLIRLSLKRRKGYVVHLELESACPFPNRF